LQRTQPSHMLVAIHLIRDGRAVVASEIRRTGRSSIGASLRWVATFLKVKLALATFPNHRTLRIYYEDLCRNPIRTVNRIRSFVGIGTLTEVRLPSEEPVHSIPGNPMLFSR